MTRDQQVSPRQDLGVLYVDTMLDGTACSFYAGGGHGAERWEDRLELEHAEVRGREYSSVLLASIASVAELGE